MLDQSSREAPLAKSLANQILDWSDDLGLEVSNLKLQKVLFFCHADFFLKNRSLLVRDSFEAWEHGPVVPNVYQEFKRFGDGAIFSRAKIFDPITATSKLAVLPATFPIREVREAFDFYIRIGAWTLRGLSHVEGGPWDVARQQFDQGENADRVISNDLIHRFHRIIR